MGVEFVKVKVEVSWVDVIGQVKRQETDGKRFGEENLVGEKYWALKLSCDNGGGDSGGELFGDVWDLVVMRNGILRGC